MSTPEDTDESSEDPAFAALLREAARIEDEPPRVTLPLPGRIVGEKYRIEERIGRGGMGAVYRATHVVSQKPVALKWMLRSAFNERAHQRFLHEARAAARIDHPNVVDVYDLGQDGDSAYLVMELLHGEVLRARMSRERVPAAQAIELMLPAMRGVSAVHLAGVIHRDLKPENIFLCTAPDGSTREAKVLDFGISAITASTPHESTLARDGVVLGTPAYMPPEQLRGSHDLDVRTDVYAFGVILYEAISGVHPFAAGNGSELLAAIANSTPSPLRKLCPEVPTELENVVMRALAREPAQRHASMDTLIDALLPFASHAAPASKRSTRWLWAAGALITLGVFAAVHDPARPEPHVFKPSTAAALVRAAEPTIVPEPALVPEPSLAPKQLPAVLRKRARKPVRAPAREQPTLAPQPPPSKPEARSGKIYVDEL